MLSIRKHITTDNLLSIALFGIMLAIAIHGAIAFRDFAIAIGATHLLSTIDMSFVIACGLAVVLYAGYIICHYLFTDEGKKCEPFIPMQGTDRPDQNQ